MAEAAALLRAVLVSDQDLAWLTLRADDIAGSKVTVVMLVVSSSKL